MQTIFKLAVLATLLAPLAAQQTTIPAGTLDPTRNLPVPPPSTAAPLPEQYIWTAGDLTVLQPNHSKFPWNRPDLRIAPHFFRTHFTLATVPAHATLYLAGPREAHVYLNGHLLGDFASNPDAPINFRVFHADAGPWLKPGENVLAMEVIRGKAVVSGGGPIATTELAYGEVLAAKLLPAAFGVEAAPLVISDAHWKSTATESPNWQTTAFNDSAWPAAQSLGPIENIDFYQWSADAGMYGWPGYRGMSTPLRTYSLPPATITHIFHPELFKNLTKASVPHSSQSHRDEWGEGLSVTLQPNQTDAGSPSILLDFGREVAGRLLVESASPEDATLSIAYGESELEALATGLTSEQQGGNYLGTNLLDVPANGTARGPKSAFRYVRIRFLRGPSTLALKSIRLEGIYYPEKYAGSFESSDPLLNRIWESAAYTAHLCMQDGIWDAPKRDRGRWVGDLDVEGRVILDVFGDPIPIEDTLRALADGTVPGQHVNGIASYTALWITSLQTLYQHTGDKTFLESQHENLLRFLARLDKDFGADNLLAPSKAWNFVDWAPGMYAQTNEARIGSNLQYLRAYDAGQALLEDLGDKGNAQRISTRKDALQKAAKAAYLNPSTGTVGSTWQLNTLATNTNLNADHRDSVWNEVLSHVKQDTPTDQVISPYFSAYLLDAMSGLHHPESALAWIRTYWGGMLAEGATSFWESYDLRWPKTNPHLSLQADGTSGFFVSLAHGWSSGPAAWLTENVLGVTPDRPGYDFVRITPNLFDLTYARGSVPTPHGPILVEIEKGKGFTIDIPPGIQTALITFPDQIPVTVGPGHHVFKHP